MVRVVKKEAKKIISNHNRIIASERDREIFFNAVFAHQEPNQNLREAADRYKLKKA